jgi:hypothetical protein
VVELLKDDDTIARVRAYVLDSITEAQKVEIPEDIKKEFSKTDRWPKDYCRTILHSKDDLSTEVSLQRYNGREALTF